MEHRAIRPTRVAEAQEPFVLVHTMALKFRLKRTTATGLVIGRDRISVFRSDSLEGPVEFLLEGKTHAQLLNELDDDNLLDGQINVAIDPGLDFLVTRKGKRGQKHEQYQEYLEGQVEGGLVSHTTESGSGFNWYSTLHAFPKPLVKAALEALGGIAPSLRRMVPSTHALTGLAIQKKAAPKGWRCHVRVLVGSDRGMAILLLRDQILARRIFGLPPEGDCSPIIAGLRSLISHSEGELGIKQIDGVVFHAAERLGELVLGYAKRLELKGILAPPMDFSAGLLAETLAGPSGGRLHAGSFDIFDKLGDPSRRAPKFPLAAAAPALAAVGLTAAWLYQEGSAVQGIAEQLEIEASALQEDTRTGPLSVDDRLDALRLETGITHSFLVRRAFWAGILEELPSLVPAAARIEALSGRYPLLLDDSGEDEGTSYGEGERFVRFDCTVPVGDASSPPEVGQLNSALKRAASIQANFPVVNGAAVQILPDQDPPMARLSATCEPRGG